MRRFEWILGNKPELQFPEDVAQLKACIPALRDVDDHDVQDLYMNFCDWEFSSGWMTLNPYMIREFEQYVLEEVDASGVIMEYRN